MDYSEAFPDLAGILLEESWVLEVAPSELAVSFRLEAAMVPGDPGYHPPAKSEQHCYVRGWLTVRSTQVLDIQLAGAAPARDASGETDFGHIDRFDAVGVDSWELSGDWGSVRVTRPEVFFRPT